MPALFRLQLSCRAAQAYKISQVSTGCPIMLARSAVFTYVMNISGKEYGAPYVYTLYILGINIMLIRLINSG